MSDSNANYPEIQLPGYKLVRRLGAGGYGEVWLADAPGGLTKAVKFIFGYHNEKRAESELRSLEKIKAVRHPFLLSLERIEVIEGRLVIVNELADGSLKDRFDESLQTGLPGIPRAELLGYLRDSADALDYLSIKHSLQHLDVKPENLLLLAGHIKVADFGLVKEIQDTQVSLVGGMTPVYSAPEVFQGRPTSFSDQYSLAILYQEMLTGILPFPGTTSAELTLQHMHDEPDLSPLPLEDRYIVARALSKDPLKRYPSCRDFVDALLNAAQSGSGWQPTAGPRERPETPVGVDRKSRPGTMTQVFEGDLVTDMADVSESMLLELPPAAEGQAPELPAMELDAEDFQPQPTLVIGIGGTAGYVLRSLRKKLDERPKSEAASHIQLLLLDTDKKALLATTRDGDSSSLSTDETMALKLRRPQEYRDQSKRLLNWLSRRWLYNIPKSLLTEGLRPLGRLAFADHARRTVQRIRLSLNQAMERTANPAGSEAGMLPVRIYVVASVSGGTGSGMSIDIGYALRSLLDKMEINNYQTTGIMLHSTGRDSRFCDLAKVNAFSWLKEYRHFAQAHGLYPGDEASGLPAMPVGTPPFDNTYFVKLGDGLTLEQHQERSKLIAEYLELETCTSARSFFDSRRRGYMSTCDGQPTLRTFGLHQEATFSPEVLSRVTQKVCEQVVSRWSGTGEESRQSDLSDTNQLVCGAPQAVAKLQLNLEGISANARTILERQFGTKSEQLLENLVAEFVQQGIRNPLEMRQAIDALFARGEGAENAPGRYILGRRLDSVISPLGMKLAGDLQSWLLRRLDQPQERLAGTRQAAEWLDQHLQRVESDAARMAKGIAEKLVGLVQQHTQDDCGQSIANAEECFGSKYLRHRLDLCALQSTSLLVRMLRSELKNVGEAIIEFGRHLRHLADTLAEEVESSETTSESPTSQEDPAVNALLGNLSEVTIAIDEQLQGDFINEHGGLFQTLMGSRKVQAQLLEHLQSMVQKQVMRAVQQYNLVGDRVLSNEALREYQEQAESPLLALGGVGSSLVVLPKARDPELVKQVRETLGNEVSVLSGTSGNLIVCGEGGQLPLMRVAIDLIECRRDYAEFAARVHTRSDISWTPIIEAKRTSSVRVSEFATQVI